MEKARSESEGKTIPLAHIRLAQRGEDPVMVLTAEPWERESIYGRARRQGPAPGAGKCGFDSTAKSVGGKRSLMISSALLGQEHIDYLIWAIDVLCDGAPFLPPLQVRADELAPCDPAALAHLYETCGLRKALDEGCGAVKDEIRYAVAATEVWCYDGAGCGDEDIREVVPVASALAALADARMATEGLLFAIGQREGAEAMEGLLEASIGASGSMYAEDPWSLWSYCDFFGANGGAMRCRSRVLNHYNMRRLPQAGQPWLRLEECWDAAEGERSDGDRLIADLFGAFSIGTHIAIGKVKLAGKDSLKEAVELVTRSEFGLPRWYRLVMEGFGAGHVKVCQSCGNVFVAGRGHADYCSDSCRVGASRRRR